MESVQDWDRIDAMKYRDEADAVEGLLERWSGAGGSVAPAAIAEEAAALVRHARKLPRRRGAMESFLQEFSLATKEGLALMCLAEALLRTPDDDTRDRLIAESVASGDWASHLGHSDDIFVNASTWGLMLTGELVDTEEARPRDLAGWIRQLAGRLGEPVIRRAVATAIRIMSNQFVLGRGIEAALARASKDGFTCSFDMLGEGARTAADAERYERLYAHAIEAVGERSRGAGPAAGHGVSVKLSALSPRFEAVQQARIDRELYPRLLRLAVLAAQRDLNFTIDAEEADRLVPMLGLFERLAREPALNGWTGLGLAVQAYQKRAPEVIAGLTNLARETGRRFMVRLVKGAYWDSEIKRAQIGGMADYPVFTTKPATDLSYLVCARALIDAAPSLYAQFATHNAHTLAAVRMMARAAGVDVEFQRLHGMGEELYRAAAGEEGLRLRVYAPVGGHEELLPYLVRRLLENGANSSFVHALLDESVAIERLVADPAGQVGFSPLRNPRIPLPADIYGPLRRNSKGRDFSIAAVREKIGRALTAVRAATFEGGPIVSGDLIENGKKLSVFSPNTGALIGHLSYADSAIVDRAIALARDLQPKWAASGGMVRAVILRAMGDVLERDMDRLAGVLALEAGKIAADGVAEVREAVDFCRYYACLAEERFAEPLPLRGPAGETNQLELHGRGVFACISPWNFPLSIFTGQIAAALAAGNAVVAKPAEQTSLTAAYTVGLFHAAGLDPRLLALLPGKGSVIGPLITSHPGIAGVAFTGGTETAWAINRTLAARDGPIIPFIAETGGLNAIFADSSALREQVIDDAILSAFGSAGQRCSALRILFLPEETADDLIAGLIGALDARVMGQPEDFATDIGPVIDGEARAALDAHVERLRREAKVLYEKDIGTLRSQGSFFAPVIAEIPSPTFLQREVFGPILHVCRYRRRDLSDMARALAGIGYGLTLGIHSRVDGFVDQVRRLVPAGNIYVNRSIIGAVVGVQPFGGEGLSGTGPKAGGPNSLLRYATERSVSVNIAARGGDPSLFGL